MDFISDINIKYTQFGSICRFCLKRDHVLKPIFHQKDFSRIDDFASEYDDNETVVEIIQNCTGLKLSPNDKLPQLLCSNCNIQLYTCDQFRRQCRKSNEILENSLKIHKIELENDENLLDKNFENVEMETSETDTHVSSRDEQELNLQINVISEKNVNLMKDETQNFEDDYEYTKDELIEVIAFVDDEDDNFIEYDHINIMKESENDDDNNKNVEINSNMVKDEKGKRTVSSRKRCNGKAKMKTKPTAENIRKLSEVEAPEAQKSVQIKKTKIITKKKRFRKLHQCQVCGKMYRDLKSHMVSHTGIKNYKCSYCGKVFGTFSNVNKHELIHKDVRPFKCDYCEKTFKHSASLRAHHIHHTNEQNYQCDQCGEKFKYATTLSYHKKRHNQDRRYKCSECGQEFITKHCLTKHQLVHTDEKPYECEVCGKKFKRTGLFAHRRTHQQDMVYKCNECGSEIKHKISMKSHLKKIHNLSEDVINASFVTITTVSSFAKRSGHNGD